MSTIRVDVNFTIFDGAQVSFKSPANFADVTGLRVYYPETSTVTNSQDFIFADAHGVDVTDLDDLFGESAMVKVLLDTVHNRAFVQNADTNSYLENRFKAIEETPASQDKLGMMSASDKKKLDDIPGDAQQQINDKVPVGEKVIDSNIASMKVVPKGSGKYAAVNKVGGMSYKSRNLLENKATTQTANGVTFTVNEDKSVTVKGTSTTWTHLKLNQFILPKGNYIITLDGGISKALYPTVRDTSNNLIVDGYIMAQNGFAFTLSENKEVQVNVSVAPNVTVDTTVYPMIRLATETDTTWQPYYSGIRNAYVNKITTTGKNLLNITATTQTSNGVTFTVNADKSVAVSGTATAYTRLLLGCETVLPKGNYVLSGNLLNSGLYLRVYNINTNEIENDIGNGIDFSSNGTDKYQFFIIVDSDIQVNTIVYPMLRRATEETNTNYEPYKESILEIPDAIKDLDGYGLGINQNYYNYIDWERKVFVRNCVKVDLGTLDWTMAITGDFAAYLPTTRYWQKDTTKNAYFLNSHYSIVPFSTYAIFSNDKVCSQSNSSSRVCIYDTEYTDVETFKAAMSGKYLVYALETPEEIDISDYLPDDNFLEVAPGGIITAVNEYNYDAPTEIEFYVGDSNKDIVVADTFVGNLIGTATAANRLTNLIEDFENPGCYYRMVNNEKEWINPPMEVDAEYRTTERWLGKPVYTQILEQYIAAGAGSTTEIKAYPIPISMSFNAIDQIVKYNGAIHSNMQDPKTKCLPYADLAGGSVDIYCVQGGTVELILNKVFLMQTNIRIQIWYTKN